jgi:predicted DsbA family dithiol-disulfide isomerase
MAQQIGIRGVPFFLFNNSFGVSGAQPVSAFADALKKASEQK